MESSSSSVQYQHVQLSKLQRSDVEKNPTRNRRRENCGKVEADVELGLAYRQALLQRRVRVHQLTEDTQHPVSKVRISRHKVQGQLSLEVQIKMTQRQVLKCGEQMQR